MTMDSVAAAWASASKSSCLDDRAARACVEAMARLVASAKAPSRSPLHALDAAHQAVVLIDLDRRIVGHNQRLTALTGFAGNEVLGQSCGDGLRSWDCGTGCRLFSEGLVCGRRCEMQVRSGDSIKVIKSATVLRDETGQVVGGFERLQLLSADDVEAAGRGMLWPPDALSTPIVEALLSSRGQAELAIGRDGELFGLSRGARELLQMGGGALAPQSAWSLFSEPQLLRSVCDEVVACGETRRLDDVSIHAPGRRYMMSSLELSPLMLDGDEVVGVVARLRPCAPEGCDGAIVGETEVMRRLRRTVRSVAARDVTVLISGESGSGKEVVARAIHRQGARAAAPFHAVNCAALSEELLESELFGHERGSFTNAFRDKRGRLELCNNGTLFLDEVACLTPKMQAKLLRVLEQREYERVGGTETLHFSARIISATNTDLPPLVQTGAFREDLYYRLCVVPLKVPPLRARRADVPLLAHHLLRELTADTKVSPHLTSEAQQAMMAHAWPGNVRELRNALEYALAMGDGETIHPVDLPDDIVKATARAGDHGDERSHIEQALAHAHYNRAQAASALGLSRTTLWRRMRALGIG